MLVMVVTALAVHAGVMGAERKQDTPFFLQPATWEMLGGDGVKVETDSNNKVRRVLVDPDTSTQVANMFADLMSGKEVPLPHRRDLGSCDYDRDPWCGVNRHFSHPSTLFIGRNAGPCPK